MKSGSDNMKNGVLYVIITAILFTTFEPVCKLFAHEINPYAITALRFLIGSLVLLPFSIRETVKKKIKLKYTDFVVMVLLGVLFICVSMVLLQVSLKMADSPALIAIIFSANSVFTIILSVVFLKVKVTKLNAAGIILCIVGVILCGDFTQGSNTISVILGLLSAITFSVYTVLAKKYMTKVSGVIQTGISFFSGSVILLIILLLCGINVTEGISQSNALLFLYVAIFVTGIGYAAYFAAMKTGGAQLAAISFMIKPILTPFATFFINGIVPDKKVIIALILVVAGLYMASKKEKSKLGEIK